MDDRNGEPKRSKDAFDLLTHLCDDIATEVKSNSPVEDVRGIIFLNSPTLERGGIQIFGYEGEDEDEISLDAMADVFVHLKAVFKTMGKELKIESRP